MARKSKLAPHASQIHRLLREGATVMAIRKDLRRLGVTVSYEGLRKWILAHPAEGISLSPPGRPRSMEPYRFDFLPDGDLDETSPKSPVFLLAFVAICAETEDIRLEVTKRAFGELGLAFDDSKPRGEWVIAAHRLAKASDLEYCLITYLVGDLPSPPLSGITQRFEEWSEKLMIGASRLKDAAIQGRDIKGKDLFGERKDVP